VSGDLGTLVPVQIHSRRSMLPQYCDLNAGTSACLCYQHRSLSSSSQEEEQDRMPTWFQSSLEGHGQQINSIDQNENSPFLNGNV